MLKLSSRNRNNSMKDSSKVKLRIPSYLLICLLLDVRFMAQGQYMPLNYSPLRGSKTLCDAFSSTNILYRSSIL